MGQYADYEAGDAFSTKKSGSHIRVIVQDADDPSLTLIGAATGIQWSDNYEVNVVEEAGNDGADEIVQGRHAGSGSISAFFTPERNDKGLTRQDFIGRKVTIFEMVGVNREGEGTVLNAFVGAVVSGVNSGHGARGLKTYDQPFVYERRYSGREWADKVGTY